MSLVYGAPQPSTVTPVVQVAAPHGEIGVADVLVNIVTLIGVLALLVVLIGLVTGGLFILFRRGRRIDRGRHRGVARLAYFHSALVNASSASVRTAIPLGPLG
jgi:hypothetical protein